MAAVTTERPTITALRVLADDRILHFEVDDDLHVKLMQGGAETSPTASYVLVTLDVDGEPCDVVTTSSRAGMPEVEAIDRAISALEAIRKALTA